MASKPDRRRRLATDARRPNAAPARPKAKGRPAKSEKPEQSLQTPPTVLEHGYDGKDAFLKAQKEWAATLLPDQRFLSVTSGTLFDQGSKFCCGAIAAVKCSLNYAGWSAWCSYNVETRTLSRRFTPSTAHGSFDKSRCSQTSQ